MNLKISIETAGTRPQCGSVQLTLSFALKICLHKINISANFEDINTKHGLAWWSNNFIGKHDFILLKKVPIHLVEISEISIMSTRRRRYLQKRILHHHLLQTFSAHKIVHLSLDGYIGDNSCA